MSKRVSKETILMWYRSCMARAIDFHEKSVWFREHGELGAAADEQRRAAFQYKRARGYRREYGEGT